MKLSFRCLALVVMGALICGCAEEVEDVQPSANGTVTMKTTISLSENASTRALTEAGVKTFAAGDKIAVVYEQESGTAKALSDALTTDDIDATNAHKATFSMSLTNPKASASVRYIYPATTLTKNCYSNMFNSCTGLTKAYVKAAFTNTNYECISMFYGCNNASTSTFYSDDAANWKSNFASLSNWKAAAYPTE